MRIDNSPQLAEDILSLQVYYLMFYLSLLAITYSCCCRSTYTIDYALTDAGGACKTSLCGESYRENCECTEGSITFCGLVLFCLHAGFCEAASHLSFASIV